ncbi:hypothetical protein [Fibrobacter sp. UWEL]|uniref:hypothetical protein n=1 Tax=Fibrobacter sp. UWEL TaxID=1896209 RepID=UPI00091C9CB8|nr:hypothetical protein [Fibrobacter sp. UWEL]SHK70697.1 hypothetical protein SAMN05720468_105144 [Fibrobacter sp. UWEL]
MAFSFLNGKSPFDEAEERLEAGETINGKPKMPKAPVMGWSDGVFLIVIIAAVVGGYQYYKYAKNKTAEVYAQCQALYEACATDASKYIEMEECYKGTMDLSFTSDSLEILGQNRLVEVDSMRFIQQGFLTDAKSFLKDGDTTSAVKALKEYKGAMLLNGVGEKAEWEKIESLGK